MAIEAEAGAARTPQAHAATIQPTPTRRNSGKAAFPWGGSDQATLTAARRACQFILTFRQRTGSPASTGQAPVCGRRAKAEWLAGESGAILSRLEDRLDEVVATGGRSTRHAKRHDRSRRRSHPAGGGEAMTPSGETILAAVERLPGARLELDDAQTSA